MAGLTPSVSSPFGNRPNTMGPDGPTGPELPDGGGVGRIASGQNSVGTPAPSEAPAPGAEAGAPDADLDQFLAAVAGGGEVPGELPQDPEGMSTQPEPQGWQSAKEQIQESLVRFKNAFTVTGPESVAVLKQSGMFDDVRQVGSQVQVRRKGRSGWEPFDREKFELLGDTLDFARDAFESIVENSIRGAAAVAGTVGGAAAGTPGGPPGMAAGAASGGTAAAAAGGAAGAVAAKNAGDIMAQNVFGIPRDPNRSMVTENALAAGFGGAFSMIGSVLARRSAARAAQAMESSKTLEHATQRAKETVEDIAEIQKSGIKLGQDGKFRMDPQQMVGAGQVPELDATAKELSTEQSFRNFRRTVEDQIKGAYDSIIGAFKAQSRGASVGEDFVLTAKDVRNLEGKLIGTFRDQAETQLRGVSQPAPRTFQTLQFVNESIQSAGHAERQLGLTPAQARNFMNEVGVMNRLFQRTGGSMRVDTAYAVEKRLTQAINNHIDNPNGRAYAMALMDLRNAVRDDGLDMMEGAFAQMGGGAQGGNKLLEVFQKSRARYSEIMSATRELGGVLQNENISKNALVGKLFEGKDSYKFMQSAKTLIQETNPKLWDDLSAEYFRKLRFDATDPVSGSVNWGQISKKWSSLDDRTKVELLRTTGIPPGGMAALMKVATKVQGASFEALARPPETKMLAGLMKQVFVWSGGGATAQGSAAGSLIEGMGKDQAVMRWLQDGGMEEVLKQMPGLKPERKAMLRDWAASWAPAPVRKAAPATAAVVREGAKTRVRRSAEEAQAE